MNPPRATMRLQFNSDFTFANPPSHISYLASLGISHVYASPIMTARRRSMHGYDLVDLTQISPVLGGEDEFISLVEELRRYELGIIVDIVLAKGRDDGTNWAGTPKRLSGKRKIAAAVTLARQGTET